MFRALWIRSFRDSFALLAGCCLMMTGFIWLRLWIVSKIDFDAATTMFMNVMPEFIRNLLPVPFEVIATIEGRVTFSYEELAVGLLLALWTVTRGSECLAGRQGDGTMEMLLAQPVRRLTLVVSHVTVTIAGIALIALAAFLGTNIGIATVTFDQPTEPSIYLPAPACLFCVGVCMAGAATLASAIGRSRAEAVALFVGFYVTQITCKLLGLMVPAMAWLKKLSFISAYEPTILTLGIHNTPTEHWPLFWQYNGTLLGLGFTGFALAATLFCHRDVPAPL